MSLFRKGFLLLILLLVGLFWRGTTAVYACGGLFCQNSPVDQNAERIIFTDNGDGTVSAIIQIQYTGFAEDFSWILPLPAAISAEDVAAPETAMTAFTEIELATNPVFIPPPAPPCAQVVFEAAPEEAASDGVEVFASGEVGPFAFDVVGSENPNELINWLRDNEYTVTEAMEPLIDLYVVEKFVFLAMRLQPERGVQDIQPIQVTYPAERPMIPLRLTAVAANPNMAVLTWFFADEQAIPVNYAHMEIPDEAITFFTGGGNNYRQLMAQTADQFNGQAFITEFAGPASDLNFSDPLLVELAQRHPYLTRLNTVISPDEMTVDPIFDFEDRPNVFNVHDLSNMTGLYDCERDGSGNTGINLPGVSTTQADSGNDFATGVGVGVAAIAGLGAAIGAGILIGRRSAKKEE